MKNLRYGFFVFLVAVFFAGCKKTEGPGGTSSITGNVTGQDHESAKVERTEIIFTGGSDVEHGDYWILNSPENGTDYYVWYDNPTWITNGDPMLSGRTGISVSFNYSDSNAEIAANTTDSLMTHLTADFVIDLNNDVLILTSKNAGYAPDANNMTSPFEFNIAEQGKDGSLSASTPRVNEQVYLVYGDNTIYGESVKTGGDGDFRFDYLTKGNYRVYVISKDTLIENGTLKIEQEIVINSNKSVLPANTFNVLY